MRTLITDGIVVNEPQIKVSNKGKEYVEFRAVNHDNNEDFWFTCVAFQPNLINFIKKWFKKGTRANFTGSYKDNPYKNKEGEIAVDHSVVLFDASFVRDGSKQGDGQQSSQHQQKQDDMEEMTSEGNSAPAEETPKEKKGGKTKPKPEPKVSVEETPDDDLPF